MEEVQKNDTTLLQEAIAHQMSKMSKLGVEEENRLLTPFILSQEEVKTLRVSLIIDAIGEKTKSPSELAGIPLGERCFSTLQLDKQFENAVDNYGNLLKDAIDLDEKISKNLEKPTGNKSYVAGAGTGMLASGLGGAAWWGGVLVLSGTLAPALVIGGTAATIGGGAYWLMSGSENLEIEKVERDGSANRRKWLYNLEVRELARIEKAISMCDSAIEELAKRPYKQAFNQDQAELLEKEIQQANSIRKILKEIKQ